MTLASRATADHAVAVGCAVRTATVPDLGSTLKSLSRRHVYFLSDYSYEIYRVLDGNRPGDESDCHFRKAAILNNVVGYLVSSRLSCTAK
jgi:hypothetical protein